MYPFFSFAEPMQLANIGKGDKGAFRSVSTMHLPRIALHN